MNAALGYAFDFGLRLEGLFFYSTASIGSYELNGSLLPGSGTLTNYAGLLNIIYDIPTGSGFTPYINAGVGASSVRVSNASRLFPEVGFGGFTIVTASPTFNSSFNGFLQFPSLSTVARIEASAQAFIYQLGAGIRYAATPNLAVNIGYRFTGTSEFTLPNSLGTGSTFSSQSLHIVEAGVRWEF